MLTYRRKKTGQLLSIRWEKCMQDIVDKYPGNFSTYLLPIIIHIRKDERLQYKNSICLVNRRLKRNRKKVRACSSSDYVCGAPFMGQCCQRQTYSSFCNK